MGTPSPKKSQNVLRVFPKGVKFTGVPGGGVPDKGSEIKKHPDALRAPTPAGHGVDPGGGKPPQYALIPLWNFFPWVELNVCHPDIELGVRGERVNTASWLRRSTSQ